ncbi:MAG: VOC family protein [Thermoplasmata archaeon]
MAPKVKPIPRGFRTATHVIVVDDGAKALDFYARALGAKERSRALGPSGKVWHAEIEVGDSVLMLSDEFPESDIKSPRSLGGTSSGVWMYVPDVDVAFKTAVAAGAKPTQEPQTMFWGDRFGSFLDPFGHVWTVATHVEDVSPEDRESRRVAAMKAMGEGSL